MKWIETPNGGLINADYIIMLEPTQEKVNEKIVYTIKIIFISEQTWHRINFDIKEERDQKLDDLKCFLKRCDAGTFVFNKKEK